MEYSTNFNFALPSRDNDVDLADINELANNFRKIDEKATKKQDFENLKNEVEDARVGADGKAYFSAGEAIRSQVEPISITWIDGYYISPTGNAVATSDRICTDFIPCVPDIDITFKGNTGSPNVSALTFYDKEKNVIATNVNLGANGTEFTITIPKNASFLRVSSTKTVGKWVSFSKPLVYELIKSCIEKEEPKKIYYVSVNGNDDNDGLTLETPFATVGKAVKTGATIIAIERGEYFASEVLNFEGKNNIHIYAYDNDEAYSHSTPKRQKASLIGGAYYTDYSKNEDGVYYCANATCSNLMLVDNEETRRTNLVLVSTYDECKATKETFYTDGTNLYFNTDNATFTKIATAKINSIFTFKNCNNVLIEDIACNVAIQNVINMEQCSGVVFNNCETNYALEYMGFALVDSDAIFNNCSAYRNKFDGFNFHGYGTTVLNDCVSRWNGDDGCSHHYGCIGTVNGGKYTGNGKCGIAPAYGGTVNIYNAVCDYNVIAGIGYLSTNNGHAKMKGLVNGCSLLNNLKYGLQVESLCEVTVINCKFKDNAIGDIQSSGVVTNLDKLGYRLINTTTLEEDAQLVTFSTDANGNSLKNLDLKKVFILFTGSFVNTTSSQILCVLMNSGEVYQMYKGFNITADAYCGFWFESEKIVSFSNRTVFRSLYPATLLNNFTVEGFAQGLAGNNVATNSDLSVFAGNLIENIKFGCFNANNKIKAGSTVYLFGE